MNVDNLQRRTKSSTCGNGYHWLYWSNRSQEQAVNTATRGFVRPLQSSTWTTLKRRLHAFLLVHNYAGGGHNMSPPEPSMRTTLNHLPPLLNVYPSLSFQCPLHPSHPIFPTQQHFAFITLMNPLQYPPRRTLFPFCTPLTSWQLSPPIPLSKPTLTNTLNRHVCAWLGIIIRFVMSSYYSLL